MKLSTTSTLKKSLLFVFFISLLFYSSDVLSQANSITSGVTFTWDGPQPQNNRPATLESITINGELYNTFAVPSGYSLMQVGPAGPGDNSIRENGTQILGTSADPTWNAAALSAYQDLNLNHYFSASNNGQNICNDYPAVPTTVGQIQSVTYSPAIPVNTGSVLAVSERNANNCQHISLFGTLPGSSTVQLLGQTFVTPDRTYSGPQPNLPPPAGSDYWLTERVNDTGGTIGIALYYLEEFAPAGSWITEIRFTAATVDVADGKFLIMQQYAIDECIDIKLDRDGNGNVGLNDNVPAGSEFSLISGPSNGTLTFNSDGTYNYQPNAGYSGADSFEYEVCLPPPNRNVCDTATVCIGIGPDAQSDSAVVETNSSNNRINVLDNDIFGSSGPQAGTAITNSTNPANGTVTLNNNGTPSNPLDDYFTYTPNGGFLGTDSFTYEITDAAGNTATATVIITVAPDTDNDNVPNPIDLDDDNDGILDSNESQECIDDDYIQWGLNSPIGGRSVDFVQNAAITNWLLASTGNIATGAGLNSTSPGSELQITSLDAYTYAEALANNEYIQVSFTTGSGISGQMIERLGLNWYQNSDGFTIGNSYDAAIAISSDNFATSHLLNTDVQIHYPSNGVSEFFDLLPTGTTYRLEENTTYTLRFYAYNQTNDGNVAYSVYDDFTIRFSGCQDLDTDGDGTADHLEGDSDADGCADAIEAGNTDPDGDLVLGNSPVTVNPNGQVTGQGGYSGTNSNVTIATRVTLNTAPIDQMVNNGGSVSFSIDLDAINTTNFSGGVPNYGSGTDSSGQLRYQWQENGTNLSNGGVYSGANTATLTISNTSGLDNNTYTVLVTHLNNACFTLDRTATLSITPEITINDSSTVEGTDNVFTITSSAAISQDVIFNIGYTNISTTNADYSGPNTVTLAANTTSATFSVTAQDDSLIEGDETFNVTLSPQTPIVSMLDDTGEGTILDNDSCTNCPGQNDFNADPNWTGQGNTTNGSNFGYSSTTNLTACDTGNGEIGGVFSRESTRNGTNSDRPYYGTMLATTATQDDDFSISGDFYYQSPASAEVMLVFAEFGQPRNLNFVGIHFNDQGSNDFRASTVIADDDPLNGTGGIGTDCVDGSTYYRSADVISPGNGPTTFTIDYNAATRTVTGAIGSVQLNPTTLPPGQTFTIDSFALTMPSCLIGSGNVSIYFDSLCASINDNSIEPISVDFQNDSITINEADGTATINVVLTGNATSGLTLDYASGNGTATSGQDYDAVSSSLTFAGNDGEIQTITIPITDDSLLELTENFFINLSNPSNPFLEITTSRATINIEDNDAPGAGDGIAVSDFTVNENVGTADFVVTYTGPTVADAFTVDFSVSDGSAINPDDYTVATAGTNVAFPAGTTDGTTQVVTINIVNDALLETSEDLSITLSNISNALVAMVDANGTGNITDNDAPGAGDGIAVSDFTVNENVGTADFVVTYTGPTVADAFTVDFAVADGSAIDPDDYTVATAGTNVSFPAGTTDGTTQVVTINIVDDALLEASEDLNITLSNISNALVAMVDANGIGNITDNDAPGAGDGIAVSDFTVNENVGTADFVVTYTGPTVASAFTVDFSVADGSAIDPDDYTVATAGTNVAFPAGTTDGTTQVVTINIVDDALLEASEDLNITLSNISNALVAMVDANGIGNITDNDAPGAGDGIAVSDFTVNENVGTADFVVTYTGPTVADAFTVDFSVSDGSAINPDDYTVATAGTNVAFPAGTTDGTTQVVTINIVDDALLETSEDLAITLSNISNALVAMVDANGTGNITDNDAPGAGDGIAVSDFTVDESVGTADFVVTYTGPTVASAFTVDFSVADGSAIDPDDYTVATAGTSVSFPAGTTDGTTQVVTINIVDDALLETSEDLSITLSNISNALVAMVDANGIGNITDNDAPGAGDGIAVSDFTVNENVGTADFVVTYTGPTVASAFTVDFSVADGSAIDPDDYTVATAGTSVSFPAGTTDGTTQVVTINIVDDALLEASEDLNITLSNISNALVAMVDANGTGNITDNDAPGAGDGIAVSDFTVNENVGTADFVVTYTGPTVASAFTVDFSVADGSAINPDDYTVATAGTNVAFPAGTTDGTTQVVTINIVNDALLETSEDLSITLSNISNALVAMVDANGTGNITDNDAPGAGDGIAVSDFTVNENVGTADFVVTYTGPTVASAFTVDFSVADGSAIDPDDYTVATAGTNVSFPAGTTDGTTQVVTINIVDDALLETSEDLSITLSNISNALVAMVDANGIGNITDNDAPGAGDGIAVSDFTVNENVGTADFVVTYTGPTVASAFTVDFSVADGSAIDPDDYTVATAGTNVSFPAGTTDGTTQVVTINIVDDALLETSEDLSITLSNISNALVAMVDANGIGNITDNDAPGAGDGIAVSDFTVNENVGTADFVVTYTGPTVASAFTVDFSVADGSAIDPDDYTVATAGTSVSFPAGTTDGTTQVVTINIVDDALLEASEDLNITLSNISNALVAMVDANGTGNITDNDAPGAGDGIAVSDFTVNENVGTADFVVTYTGPTVASAFTVDFSVADGSAIDPDDYTVATAGTNVSFPAGTTDGTTQVVTINIVNDALLETSEDLSITLSNISNALVAMVDANGTGNITDNDAPGAGDGIAVSDFTVNENVGTADFVVTYTGPTVASAFTVDFSVADGSAIDPDDYTVATAGTNVSFPAGTTDGTTQVVTINIVDDALLETSEDLSITLSNISNALVAMVDANGIGNITDNDAPGAGDGIAVSDFTVNENVGTADFVVTYTGPTVASAFTVDFSVADGSAIDPDDYTVATAGTNVAFPAGTTDGTTQVVTINIVDDALLEASEDLNITLSNISNALVAMVDANGIGNITDNDAPGAGDGIAVSDFTVNENVGTADFVVTYTGPTVASAFTVDFSVADGSAIDPDDYTVATAGTNVAFPAGTTDGTTQVVTINIVDDALLEASEDLNITLSNISNALVAMVDANGIGNITDNDANDPTEGVAVADFTVNEDAGTATFVISYTGNTVQDAFNINFNVTDNTAINPDDYTVVNTDTFVTFPAGTVSGDTQLVTINIVDDMLIEATETLDITLAFDATPPAGINMLDDAAVGTITDNDGNDPTEGVAVADFTVNEDAGTATFVISYTGNTVQDAFNVNFNVTDNTAINPDDYTVVNTDTFVTFPAGTVSGDTQLVTINIVDDMLIEATETLDITLAFDATPPAGINMLDDAAVGTITDNDANGPTEGVAVADFTVNEDAGTATFVISYTGNTVQDAFNVNFNVTDNTAINPDDYTVANTDAFVTFPAGTVSGDTQLVTINIVDDMLIEATETLDIALAFDAVPPVGVNMLDDAAVGTITDNDANDPTEGVAVADFTVNEDAGTATFVISYTGSTVQDAFNINFNVTDNTAINPDDYTVANTDAFVTFPAGTVSGDTQLVTINIVDDMLIEATETLDIALAFDVPPPAGINMLDDTGLGTITDNDANDPTEGIAVSDFTVNEDAGTATFVISYTGNTVQDAFNVNFNVTDNTAINPEDYTVANTDAFVTFPAGTVSGDTQLVTINIVDDMLIEATETLDIALAFDVPPPAGINMLDDTGLGTITDNDANDPTEGVAVADFTVNEDAGTATFVISYTGNTVQDAFNINFNVTDNTAINPDDYTVANTDAFVTFPAGTVSGDTQLVTINIVDDMLIEATETLDIALAFDAVPPVGVNMLDDAAVGTITDNDANDPTEGIAVSDFTVNEDAGTATFVISYTGNTVQDAFNVNFNLTDNTAINPDDYTVANTDAFVTFPAGTVSGDTQLVTINIVDDMLIEATETLDIALAFDAVPPVGVNMLDDAAVGTITDNDANDPTEGIAVSDFTVNEDAGTATFVISYTGNTVQDAFNVNFNLTDNTAINPEDYNVVSATGTLVFPANTTNGDSQTITVNIIDDMISEMAETLDITLSFDVPEPAGINMLDGEGVGTILDNDITSSPYEEEVTIICGDELPEVPELTFMGGCGDYDVVFNEETEFSDDTDDYMVIRTWLVTDSCGNTESFQQIVFVMQPQLEEVFIDICVEDDPINLIDYLPEGFDINGTFETELDDVYLNNTTFVPYGLEIGEYKIMYSSTGGTCKYYVDFYITTNTDCVPCNRDEIKVSETVTVNGDGVNDYFEIKGVEYCEFTFDVMIFNRWGDKVYEGKDYRNDWGGIAPSNSVGNSGLVPAGTYYYIISINGSEQPLEPINGYIYVGTE